MPLGIVFKALSDGTRREILQMLRKGDLTAGEISARFDLAKPSISHHLNVLRQAGLVQDLRQGQYIFYSLNTTVFQEVLAWFLGVTETQTGQKTGNPPSRDNSPDTGTSGRGEE